MQNSNLVMMKVLQVKNQIGNIQLNLDSSSTDSSSMWYTSADSILRLFISLHSYPCIGGYFHKSESPEVRI